MKRARETKKKETKKGKEDKERKVVDDREIDDLFGDFKKAKAKKKKEEDAVREQALRDREEEKKKAELAAKARAERDATGSLSSVGTNVAASEFDFQDPKVHRVAADGLPVYKFFHLGMKQDDGGTPECPFDCKCCF